MRMTQLLSRRADSGGQSYPIDEVFFEEPSGALRYVALRTGGYLTREDVLLRVDRFGALEAEGKKWHVTLSADAIESAPTWSGGEGPPVHLEAWPPIIVGPFGSTTSPLMIWASLAESEHEEHPHGAKGDARVARLERASQRIGGEVFGSDGPLGTMADLIIDHETLVVTKFVVTANGAEHAVPYADLRHLAHGSRHAVLNLDAAALADLPPPP